ncbi:MAG: hypothetical protein HY670_12540 [Chloroflexi bacterium]|nr:hypothetical protein [Chloroflexota bacterium]
MKSSNRLLLIFGAIIGVLIIVAIALVLTISPRDSALLPEDTPEGVVQRFLQAVKDQDYVKAYSYLSLEEPGKDGAPHKVTYEEWRTRFRQSPSREQRAWKATLGKSTIVGDIATVEVIIETFRPGGGPFENPVDTSYTLFDLKKTDGSWVITTFPGLWWLY